MNKEYLAKMFDHLNNNGSYRILTRNLVSKISREVFDIINKWILYEDEKKKVIKFPRIYGLPKIHKKCSPLKPIVNKLVEPTYKISKDLSYTLKPFVRKIESFIEDKGQVLWTWLRT
jgi:hypothetical protein